MNKILLVSIIFSVASVHAETVPVSASNKEAVRLGKYESGKAITVEYKSGVWNRRADNPSESPDTTKWDQLKIIIFFEDVTGQRTVIGQPQNTKGKPFRFITRRAGNYYIRMTEPKETGSGVVVYEIIESR
jgi:hypothetical protein